MVIAWLCCTIFVLLIIVAFEVQLPDRVGTLLAFLTATILLFSALVNLYSFRRTDQAKRAYFMVEDFECKTNQERGESHLDFRLTYKNGGQFPMDTLCIRTLIVSLPIYKTDDHRGVQAIYEDEVYPQEAGHLEFTRRVDREKVILVLLEVSYRDTILDRSYKQDISRRVKEGYKKLSRLLPAQRKELIAAALLPLNKVHFDRADW